MNRRERMRRCYFHEETDRPAVYSRAGFPGDDPTYDRLKALLREKSELKAGWGAGNVQTTWPRTESRVEPHTDDFDRQVVTLHTPAGPLTRTLLVSRRGLPGLHETYFLKDAADAERYLSLPMPELGGEVDGFFAVDREIGEAGIAECGLGMNPAGTVAELFGSELFAMMSVTDRDVLHALLEREMRVILARLDYVLARGVGPFFAMLGEEYVVPPLHGPRDFADLVARYDRPILDRVHEAGGRVHIHCHGAIRAVIDQFVDMGTDVLHPFEAPQMGDITPEQAKAAARGRLTLEGNIQISDMYESTPEDVRAQTEALIAACWDDRRGLIISPTASPYIRGQGETCYPQYEAMVETVLAVAD